MNISNNEPNPQTSTIVSKTSDKHWAKSLSKQQRQECIDACLDEYESTIEIVSKNKKGIPEKISMAKSWCEYQKHILRELGYRKRLPVFGRVETIIQDGIQDEDIFEQIS